MCDIQHLVGQLIAKAEQLLGEIYIYLYASIHAMKVFSSQVTSPQTLLSHGCTYAANLMEANKSTTARVDHGRGDVPEQGFGKILGQHGVL